MRYKNEELNGSLEINPVTHALLNYNKDTAAICLSFMRLKKTITGGARVLANGATLHGARRGTLDTTNLVFRGT